MAAAREPKRVGPEADASNPATANLATTDRRPANAGRTARSRGATTSRGTVRSHETDTSHGAGPSHGTGVPQVVATARSGLSVPGPAALSVAVVLAVLLWLPSEVGPLVLAWAGSVVVAAALPFAVVGLVARLVDRGLRPR